MREHVHRLYGSYLILRIHQLQVACLGSRVAAYVHDALWCCIQDDVYYVWVHAGTWRVGDDDVRTTVRSEEHTSELQSH